MNAKSSSATSDLTAAYGCKAMILAARVWQLSPAIGYEVSKRSRMVAPSSDAAGSAACQIPFLGLSQKPPLDYRDEMGRCARTRSMRSYIRRRAGLGAFLDFVI